MIPHNKWWIIRLIYSIDLLIGAGLLIFGAVAAREAFAARDWPTATGTVTAAGLVERISGDGEPAYAADVRYTYQVNQQEYSASRISLGDFSGADSAAAETVLRRYPRGEPVTVYYDPDHPERALLEPGFPPALWLPIGIGAFFLLSGTVTAVWRFFYVRRHAEQNKPHVEVL